MSALKTLINLRHKAEEATYGLPALLVHAEHAAASILHGNHAQRRAGIGEKFWQYREYISGDRPQDIDWRQSGKTDRIYIRQKERQTTQTTLLWCNRAASMDFASKKSLPTKADVAKIITLALSILLTKGGEEIGVLGQMRKGRSSNMINHIGVSLTDDGIERDNLQNAPIPQNANIIKIGDFIDPLDTIERSIAPLAARADSGLLIQVLDPAEIALPYSGRAIFEDTSNAPRNTVEHIDSIKQDYAQRVQDHIRATRALCTKYSWHYALHVTDMEVATTLQSIWGEMTAHAGGRR